MSLLERVLDYRRQRGWWPVPTIGKNPEHLGKGWQHLKFDEKKLRSYFGNGCRYNAGINLHLSGITDLDCDDPRAAVLAAHLAPPTRSIFGRPGKPLSHREYVCRPPVHKTVPFEAPGEVMIVELRGKGQTVFPGSVWVDKDDASHQEVVEWADDGPLGEASWQDLLRCTERIAAAALLEPCWRSGHRNTFILHLAGALLRRPQLGWTRDEVCKYITAIMRAAPKEHECEVGDIWQRVRDTADKCEAGEDVSVTGVPHLRELVGDAARWSKIAQWLHLGDGSVGGGDTRRQEEATPGPSPERERQRETQASRIVKLAAEWDLFHTPDGDAYATFRGEEGEQQTWPLRSRVARDRLEQMYYTTYEGVPGGQAVPDALGVLAGRARFAGCEHRVFVRLAEHEDAIYLDLCDRAWRVVEVTREGWRVIASSEAPVRFRRSKGMLALLEPRHGGAVEDLRPFLNVPKKDHGDGAEDESAWTLIVAWLIAALRPRGPYPILVCAGEQGSAKSTVQRVLRALVDPHRVALRRPPRDERDLAIAAANNWVVGLENVSCLSEWLSDALCALSTGGGYATRALYENDEETLFDAQRPLMINGIPVVVTRGDALDRSLILRLPEIAEDKRLAEDDFWRRFEQARPGILGALLDAVAVGLQRKASVKLERLPRMADFALWVTAAESGLGWEAGRFMKVYNSERAAAHEVALQASLVAGPLWELMRKQRDRRWSGTATQLLDALNNATDEATRKRKGWPALPHLLSGELTRLAPHLRALGLTVLMARTGRKRTVDLRLDEKSKPASSASSASHHAQGGDADGLFGDADLACGDADYPPGDAGLTGGDAEREPIYAQNDADDAGDAHLHRYSKRVSGTLSVANVSPDPKVPYPRQSCPKGHQDEWEYARSDPQRGASPWYGYVCRHPVCLPGDRYGSWLPVEAEAEAEAAMECPI